MTKSEKPFKVKKESDADEGGKEAVDPKVILASFRHPNARFKVKKDVPSLPLASVWDRMSVAGSPLEIDVPTEILEGTINRKFLSNVYGGNMQSTWSYPKDEFVQQHGIKSFACLTLEYNPHTPQRPGAPGLYFGHSHLLTWPGPPEELVFTRLSSADWLYQGKYKFIRCNPMTESEYCLQPTSFRDLWSMNTQKSKWGTYYRASILCRKELREQGLDRKASKDEIEVRIGAITANKSLDTVTIKQIDDAFACGEEKIGIWAMKCVAYEEDFKRTLLETFEKWKAAKGKTEREKDKSGKNKERIWSKSNAQGSGATPHCLRKQRRSMLDLHLR